MPKIAYFNWLVFGLYLNSTKYLKIVLCRIFLYPKTRIKRTVKNLFFRQPRSNLRLHIKNWVGLTVSNILFKLKQCLFWQICPKCDFCSKDCQRSKKINEVIDFLKSEKKELEKNYNYHENKIFDMIYNQEYISSYGKIWSLKSLNKEYIVNEVFPKMENKYF